MTQHPPTLPPDQDGPVTAPPPADPPRCGATLAISNAPWVECDQRAGHPGVHHDSRAGVSWPRWPHEPQPAADSDYLRRRIRELAESVEARFARLAEQAAAPPVELEAVGGGQSVEQECRSDALADAARLLAPALAGRSLAAIEADLDRIAGLWVQLAWHGAGFIDTGERP